MSITYFHLLSSYTHSITLTVECTHSTLKPLNVHIQWLLAIECVDSSTFNTTYTHKKGVTECGLQLHVPVVLKGTHWTSVLFAEGLSTINGEREIKLGV